MSEIFESAMGNYSIEISDDHFSAFLTIKDIEDFINETELLELIAKAGITYGFSQAVQMIESKSIHKQPNQPFPLAIGDIPKQPEVEFSPLINTQKCYDPTMENQYTKLKSIQKIDKGEPLAHLFVTKPSKIGVNVLGVEVAPESYETQIINDYLGENVSYSQERGQILSDKCGYPYMDELSRIHVKSDFIVDGNVDATFSEKDFFGNLIVNGDIVSGAKLRIKGDLIVNGNVVEADIDVDGDVIISGDVINCSEFGVIASGKVSFNAAENSKIVAGGTVNFKKNIYLCKILAESGIFGHEETSSIVGGVCQSGEHVEVAIIGNTGSIGTEVEISISPYIKERMLLISKKIMILKEQNLMGSRDFVALQEELSNYENKLEDKINSIIKNIENLPKHIMAYKKIFPGTYIRILKKSKHLTELMNKASFSIVNSELTCDIF